jgi:ketosteroid isomerase-like protein
MDKYEMVGITKNYDSIIKYESLHLRVLLIFLIIGSIAIFSQGCGRKIDVQKPEFSLMEVDRQFSKLSEEQGIYTAFDTFMADSAIMYRDNAHPLMGRETIRGVLSKGSKGSLRWQPFRAEVAASGELGYTLGKYVNDFTDSSGQIQVIKGYYITVWKKQSDGQWKFIFDTGNQSPTFENKNSPTGKWVGHYPHSFEKPQ